MADNDIFDEAEEQEEPRTGRGLRAQLEQALARVKELEARNSELEARVRQVDLASLLRQAGAREGAEALYPRDREVSEKAVAEWVEQYAAFVKAAAAAEPESETEVAEPPRVPEETRVAAQRLAQLADSASSRPAADIESALERIRSAQSVKELQEIYTSLGIVRQ
ncbi:MAG: hypothetical protein IRZ06_10150 [Nevskia sp.]|nr:hypothetical protein [Nevskia sp.]